MRAQRVGGELVLVGGQQRTRTADGSTQHFSIYIGSEEVLEEAVARLI